MKKFWICLLGATAFAAAAVCSAETVKLGYNVGEIIAAETTTAAVEVFDREQSPYPHKFANPRYVVVVLKMHPRRSISSVDYSLSINGTVTPCIAAASNMEPFVCNPAVLYPENKDLVRMLFILDGSQLAAGDLNASLKANLASRQDVSFKITDLGQAKFTESSKIPAGGMLK